MKPEVRAAIAFIAARRTAAAPGGSLYDFEESKYWNFSGSVGAQVSIFDHTTRCHITGNVEKFFHHGTGAHITLNMKEGSFQGYDFGSRGHFNGRVTARNIRLSDFAEHRQFQYFLG